jgi:glycosyltransferase involved in cell wall biosynthesis
MIPSYNCSNYLRHALVSVLEQDPGPDKMQIEVVDDCSTDTDVEALVASIGKGRVGYYRQEQNMGSLRNFETCLKRSRGHWVHLLHGDDLVSPGFYQEIGELFTQYPEAGAAFTGFLTIDANGKTLYPNNTLAQEPGFIRGWMTLIAQSQQIQPPAIVVKREVYEQVGGFFAMHYGEDWEMWVRISSQFPVVHSPRQLAQYRVHDSNITSRYFISGQNIHDITRAIDIIQDYLPAGERKKLKRLAKRNFSRYFARTSDMVYHGYNKPHQALRQAKDALRLHVNRITLYFVLKIYLKLLIRYKLTRQMQAPFFLKKVSS